jgi:hypothetical protein
LLELAAALRDTSRPLDERWELALATLTRLTAGAGASGQPEAGQSASSEPAPGRRTGFWRRDV